MGRDTGAGPGRPVTVSSGKERRARTLERLGGESFDLLVVGAGIVGSRVAYEAARNGLRVALVDAGDFGGATSSASSKLIHGGLRYLRLLQLGLVREALAERRALLTRVAPHLVRRQPFLLPFYRGGPWHPVTVGAGLLLYAGLAGFGQGPVRMLGPGRARAYAPLLRQDGLRAAGLFEDAQTDDARLCLATVTAAAEAGAAVLNHAAVTAFHHAGSAIRAAAVHSLEGAEVTVACRAVVNAAGPWVDQVRRLDDPGASPLVRLSKGIHLTLPGEEELRTALIIPVDRTRVSFAIPWQGLLLLGTTDTAYEGDPGRVEATAEDVGTVLGEAGLALPAAMLQPGRVRFRFAGLRALPTGEGETAQASREHRIAVSRTGLVSVAGGKLTTHRLIAVDALRRLPPAVLGRGRSIRPDDTPLPGAGTPVFPPDGAGADPELRAHLARIYGARAGAVLAYAEREPGALERIHPQGPDVLAQAAYAIDAEWAGTVEDLARRRTTLSLRGLGGEEVRARLQALLVSKGADLPQPS